MGWWGVGMWGGDAGDRSVPDARPFFSMFAASSPEKHSKWQKNNKRLLMIRHSHIMDTSMTTSVLSRRRDIAERYAKTSWEQILFSEFSTSLKAATGRFLASSACA